MLPACGASHRHRRRHSRSSVPIRSRRLGAPRPRIGFGDVEFHADIYDKAAVLVCRLAWNHPLPDGNKRAARAALVMFVDLNDGTWQPDPPDIDEAEEAMLAITAGENDEVWTASCLKERVRFANS